MGPLFYTTKNKKFLYRACLQDLGIFFLCFPNFLLKDGHPLLLRSSLLLVKMLLTLVYQFIFQLTSFLDLKSFSVRNNRQNKFSKLYRKLRWLLSYNTTVVELLAFICSYKYLLFLQRCMLFCTQRAEPSFIRSPNVWNSKSCSLSSNWFFESEPPFIDKTDGFN